MKNKKLLFFTYILLIISSFFLIFGSVKYQREGPTIKNVKYIESVEASINGGPFKPISLPHRFKNLDHNTPVTIKTSFRPAKEDCIYIQTMYSPAKVYANNKLIFEFGKKEFYPRFMVDPARELHIIELYKDGSEDIELKVDFLSPKSSSTLFIDSMIVGTSKEIIMERSRSLGAPFIFSLVQIFTGFSLIFVSLYVIFVDRKGLLFFWLGLFSLSTGLWAFGENTFSSILFRQSTLLYVLSFIGLFTFIIPLIHFTRMIVDFKNDSPLIFLELFYTLCAISTFLLQFFGVISFTTSKNFFHCTLPFCLLFVTYFTAREALRYQNVRAKKYFLPMIILMISSIIEAYNYQRYPLNYVGSSYFQSGILLFLLLMGISAGLAIKDSIDLNNKKKELIFHEKLLDIQTKELKNTSVLLAKNEQTLKQQRHDLRHHLVIIQELAKDNDDLQTYLQTLIQNVPKADVRFCENDIVNSIISRYSSLCKEKHIQFQVQLDIPETNNSNIDSDLCAIVSNLLENALEACERIGKEQRYIHFSSYRQFEMLTITMENSFNGIVHKKDNTFFSTKRDDVGIGTRSIQSIAKKLNGEAQFNFDDHTFFSSVIINI